MITPHVLRASFGILSPEELADTLDVQTETLATWRSQNIGPSHIKLGRSVYYRHEDVQAWIKRGGYVAPDTDAA